MALFISDAAMSYIINALQAAWPIVHRQWPSTLPAALQSALLLLCFAMLLPHSTLSDFTISQPLLLIALTVSYPANAVHWVNNALIQYWVDDTPQQGNLNLLVTPYWLAMIAISHLSTMLLMPLYCLLLQLSVVDCLYYLVAWSLLCPSFALLTIFSQLMLTLSSRLCQPLCLLLTLPFYIPLNILFLSGLQAIHWQQSILPTLALLLSQALFMPLIFLPLCLSLLKQVYIGLLSNNKNAG